MKFIRFFTIVFLMLFVVGCAGGMEGLTGIKMGGSKSPVTGSAGAEGSLGAQQNMVKCDTPIATASIVEDKGSGMMLLQYGLPSDPTPLLELSILQSGCFTLVDRGAGLRAVRLEQELAQQGMLAEEGNIKSKLIASRYTIVPRVAFSKKTGGGAGLGFLSLFIPGSAGLAAGMIGGGLRFSEAQVTLSIIDNSTGIKTIAEGSAKKGDLAIGAGLFGGMSMIGGAWQNTPEAKIIAAAFVDAMNKLIPQLQVANTNPP